MQGCQSYLCDVRPEGVVAIVKVMERVVHLYPSHFPQLIQPVLPTVLRNLLEEEVGRLLLRDCPLLCSALGELIPSRVGTR